MIPYFGWSVGDIACSIKIILHIIKAFDQAKGAKKQYAASCGFLRQLLPVVKRLKAQLDRPVDDEFRDDLQEHFATINTAYQQFEDHLRKRYDGLGSHEPSKATRILATVRWSLDELHDKVQQLRDKVSRAIELYNTLVLQDIHLRIIDIQVKGESPAERSEQNEELFKEVRSMLFQIKEQNDSLKSATKDYQVSFEARSQRQRSDSTAVREDLAEIKQAQSQQITKDDLAALTATNIKREDLEQMNQAQTKLVESQNELLVVIAKQQEQASEADALRWEELHVKAEKQVTESQQAQQDAQDQLANTANLMEGLGNVSGNSRFNQVSAKVKGASQLLGAFGGLGVLGQLFAGLSKDRSSKGDSNASSSKEACSTTIKQAKPSGQWVAGVHTDQQVRSRTSPKPPPPIPITSPSQRYSRRPSTSCQAQTTSTSSECAAACATLRSWACTKPVHAVPDRVIEIEPTGRPLSEANLPLLLGSVSVTRATNGLTAGTNSHRAPPLPPRKPSTAVSSLTPLTLGSLSRTPICGSPQSTGSRRKSSSMSSDDSMPSLSLSPSVVESNLPESPRPGITTTAQPPLVGYFPSIGAVQSSTNCDPPMATALIPERGGLMLSSPLPNDNIHVVSYTYNEQGDEVVRSVRYLRQRFEIVPDL